MNTPRTILHVEGAVAAAAAVVAYAHLGGSWAVFAALFLVPDLSMLGYLAGNRVGAAAYNAGHSTIGPALVAAVGLAAHLPWLLLGACIWLAHVGADRMLGYGLKYASGFGDTHLGHKGRRDGVLEEACASPPSPSSFSPRAPHSPTA